MVQHCPLAPGAISPAPPPTRPPLQLLVMTVLLDLYHMHMSSLVPRREALLQKQKESAADAAEQWELLNEMSNVQVGLGRAFGFVCACIRYVCACGRRGLHAGMQACLHACMRMPHATHASSRQAHAAVSCAGPHLSLLSNVLNPQHEFVWSVVTTLVAVFGGMLRILDSGCTQRRGSVPSEAGQRRGSAQTERM